MDDDRSSRPPDGRKPLVRRSAPWTPTRVITLVVLLALLALVVYLKITGAV